MMLSTHFLNLSFYKVDGEASAKSFYGYPTVNSGPMDISKAKELLGFSPTPTEEAVRQTVHFYEEAFYAFPNQRDEVLSELFTSAIPKVCVGLLKNLTLLSLVQVQSS
jgi:hypothetical protein